MSAWVQGLCKKLISKKVQERATNRLFDQNYQDSPLEVSNYFTNARNKEQLRSKDRPLPLAQLIVPNYKITTSKHLPQRFYALD